MKNLLLSIFIFSSITLFSQSWIVRNNLPGLERRTSSGCSAQGKGYVMFGIKGNVNLKDLWEYNPQTDSWVQKNDYPGQARRGGIFVSNDTLVFAGLGSNGSTNFTDFRQYFPATDSWVTKASYPGLGGFIGFAEIFNGFVYVGGGVDLSQNLNKADFWKYEVATNTWTSLGSFPFGIRTGGLCRESNGLIYFGLGHTGSLSKKDFWAYNPVSNTWTQKVDFPGIDRLNPINFKTSNNELIVGAGYQLQGPAQSDYYKYDPINDVWDTISNSLLNANRSVAAQFTINDIGYVMGGWHSSQTFELRDLWSYKPAFVTSTSDLESKKLNFKIYPIPASNYINLNFEVENGNTQFMLFDLKGNQVFVQNLNGKSLENRISLTDITTGIYFYQIKSNQNIVSGKLTVIKNY